MAGTDDNEGTAVSPTADAATAPPAKKRAARAAKPDPEALAAEIERTREDLADTLDAIAEKVSPKRVAKRTTKKVTSAVKETAHDAATAVKDTASSAKGKVSRSDQSWAPAAVTPPPVPAVEALPPAEPVTVPEAVVHEVAAGAPEQPRPVPPSTQAALPPAVGPLVRPEYLAAGVAAALIAWFVVRRRR